MDSTGDMLMDTTDESRTHENELDNDKSQRLFSNPTEEKPTQKILTVEDSEDRYHKMIDEVQDYAILLMDKDGYIQNWNKGAQNIKGYREEEIIGKNFRVFYLKEDQESKLPEKLIEQATRTGKANHEGWRVRKDGTTFWGNIVITALHDKEHNIIGFSKVTRDLTERKIADDQLRYYAQSIESQNQQLEQFAYIASHDLQEPLRKIRVFASILEDNIDNITVVKNNIDKINIAATRMSALITDILKYSQLSQLDMHFQETDLNETLNSVKNDFDLIMEQKGVVIENSALPVIKGIPMQLHQLFANLISNAIKFSTVEPSIKIDYEIIDGDAIHQYPDLPLKNSYHKISFKDNGIGFEQQFADQAFKLFHRLHEKTSGTGIGLALCKKVVENHNGYISVYSKPGEGTNFTIFFPV
ncbi:sensor histidine kinase [Flavobacterium sp. PLA-1-15]|uniref:sensor histidine kinase n=1 Tax=Flavobacterium sp. PLA-1-15 TaxID=3380533 RepID=UPI003B82A088